MSSLPEVQVLLATFNGERFLREQIDSILAQDYENVRVLARDDGSSDGTVEILRDYAERFPRRFQVMQSGATTEGAKENFLLLMKASTADYISFSDQDDVWLPEKVRLTRHAMDKLEARWGTDIPLLVFTDLQVVDDKLNVLHKSFWAHMNIDPGRINRLAELLVQSVVTGCTAMLNRRLVELSLRMPHEASMHDRWIALLASVKGKSSVVKAQTVLYRQHDRNVVGIGRNAIGTEERNRPFLERVRRPSGARAQLIQWGFSQRQAEALLKVHGDEIPAKKREVIKAYLRCETSQSRFIRIATFIRYGFYYAGLLPNLISLAHLWKIRVDERKTV
jgi:glycosyltransferase involved in cell wall biosynthesis